MHENCTGIANEQLIRWVHCVPREDLHTYCFDLHFRRSCSSHVAESRHQRHPLLQMLLKHIHLLLGFVATTSLAACSAPSDPTEDAGVVIGGCRLPFVGDPNAPMEMDVIALGPNGKLVTLTNGSDITLMFPPQGGRVLFAGVRARNVNPCAVRIAGALRDPVSKQVQIDNRIVNLEVTDDGYGRSSPFDIDAFANIFACPNHWSDQDLMDAPYELTLTLTDKEGRKVTRVLEVIPRCNEPGVISGCRCQCDVDYMPGMQCGGLPVDGGVEDAPHEPSDAAGD